MAVKNILAQFGAKIGLNPNASGSRAVLLRFLNEAADELWCECDITGSILEQVFRVNGNQTIALPEYVGHIRAVRDFNNGVPTHINQLRPRYNELNWVDQWRNWRLKNISPLQCTITNSAPLVYTVNSIDSTPIIVNFTGSTDSANSITESVIMSSLSVNGTVGFNDCISLTKSGPSSSNVTVSDADGNVLAVISNDKLKSQYQIIDISSAPWLSTASSNLSNYCEILYKKTLPYLSTDDQEFPADGYDNQLVNKCLQLYYEEQGKSDLALAYDAKATRGLARKKIEQNLPAEDVVAFVTNPHDTLLPRIRSGRFMRWLGRRR